MMLTDAILSTRANRGAPALPNVYDADTLSKLAFCFASEASEGTEADSVLTLTQNNKLKTMFLALRTTLLAEMGMDAATMLYDGIHTYFLVGLILKALQTNGFECPRFPSPSNGNNTTLPVPFPHTTSEKTDDWNYWLQQSSLRIVRGSQLEQEEWCGYVSNDPFLLSISRPLQEIRLQLGETRDASRTLRGSGREGSRHFTMEGNIHCGDGRVVLVQDYPGLQRSEWHGIATIFGIVGYWTQLGSRPLGYFLIWNHSSA